MPWREFQDWQVYGLIEPYGDRMTQLAIGYLTTHLTNVYRGDKRKNKPFEMWEVFPLVRKPEPKRVDPEALAAMLSAIPGVTTRPATPAEIAELYGR